MNSNTVYVAFYGEYEWPHVVGVYSRIEEAKLSVEQSNPSYNTEVISYNILTGKQVEIFRYTVSSKKWEKL